MIDITLCIICNGVLGEKVIFEMWIINLYKNLYFKALKSKIRQLHDFEYRLMNSTQPDKEYRMFSDFINPIADILHMMWNFLNMVWNLDQMNQIIFWKFGPDHWKQKQYAIHSSTTISREYTRHASDGAHVGTAAQLSAILLLLLPCSRQYINSNSRQLRRRRWRRRWKWRRWRRWRRRWWRRTLSALMSLSDGTVCYSKKWVCFVFVQFCPKNALLSTLLRSPAPISAGSCATAGGAASSPPPPPPPNTVHLRSHTLFTQRLVQSSLPAALAEDEEELLLLYD